MKTRHVVMMLLAAFGLILTGVVSEDSSAPREGVFIHLSHGKDDPHRVLMALNMAEIMSADHDVLVYFDIKAIDVVLKDTEDLAYAQFPSLHKQLENLQSKNVQLMACPSCLKAAGKTEENLAEGVGIADKTAFFSFTKGRILTLDY